MKSETIAAIATPPGNGGIGVIKISGPQAGQIAANLFRRGRFNQTGFHRADWRPRSHRLYHGYIADPQHDTILDEVLLTVMHGPRSYTGEDVAEIQAHSGSALLERILALVLRQGARLAAPGEFTRRAFLNGRVDLTQAEAVMDTIHADNEVALRAAARQLHGALRRRIVAVRGVIVDLQTEFEAAIDFPEEVDGGPDTDRIRAILKHEIVGPLQALVEQHEHLHVYRTGLHLVIVGRPNVGKSSLMNALLNQPRAIVTPVPGTTRDFVQEAVVLQGVPVQLTDTAGLHTTENPVERLGIEKAHQCVSSADILLLVLDGSQPLTNEDERIYEFCRDKPTIVVLNKIDQIASDFFPPSGNGWDPPAVRTSALSGYGIDHLKAEIVKQAFGAEKPPEEHAVIPNLRHRAAMESVLRSIDRLLAGLENGAAIDLLSLDLQAARDGLDEILGDKVDGDVLDRIFERFCIGK